MKRLTSITALIILLVFFGPVWVATSKKDNNKKLTFVMVPKGVNPYYEPCFEGFKAAAARYNINVDMVSPPKFDLALQIQAIEDLIDQKVDGIAISAFHDTGLITVIDEAIKAGIKVITFDAPAPSTKAMSYVGTDNYKAGYEAGRKIAQLIKKKSGEVAILQGGIDTPNLTLRTKGLKQALSDIAPDIKVVAVEDTQGEFALSVNKTEELIQKHPRLNAIFGVSALETPAAALVVKDMKRKNIIVGGFDDLKDTLKGIRDGYIQFCVVQSTYKMGWLSVRLLLDLVHGKEVPKVIDTDIIIVDKHNVDSYFDEMRKGLD